jgi:hypothetical protein
MESDPILTYAPRRHDGRLGLHQWPAGYPVAYDPDGHTGKGDLCGDCASEGLGEAFRDAGFPGAAKEAREGRVVF